MTVFFQPDVDRATLSKRQPLAAPPALFSAQKLIDSVSFLASGELQGRGFGSPGLAQAADHIARAFEQAGLQPGGDQAGSYFQEFPAKGGEPEAQTMLKNVIGIIPAGNPNRTDESIIIGAHYDHLGLGWPDVRGDNRGKVHHGADDNASGVAVLIELARVLGKNLKPERNVVFVAFSGEEAGRLGSRHYTANAHSHPMSKVMAMLNLDTVGQLGNEKLLVLGGESASEWVHIFRGVSYVTGVETVLVKEQLDASDQVSFHQAGVPAVQLFTGANPGYHRPTDTIEHVDAKGMVRVATVAKEVVDYLAAREDPLSSTLDKKTGAKSPAKQARRVSLGTIPDFSFAGPGYRLQGVMPGLPAATAGLIKGDVIVRMGGQSIENLKQVSGVLKSRQPGDRLNLTFRRGKETHSVEVVLEAK